MDVAKLEKLAAFFKWRCWRFSDDLELHVLGEVIEDEVRRGKPLPLAVWEEMDAFFNAQIRDGAVEFDVDRVAVALGVDVGEGVAEREAFTRAARASSPPRAQLVVSIIGSPRSGTTTLLDRVAYHTGWAVVTDHSHHVWTEWGLTRAEERFFRRRPASILELDTRATRLELDTSWPSEAENILHRWLPAYEHKGRHHYLLHETARLVDLDAVRRTMEHHLSWFDSPVLLLKSPFNVSRTDALREALGGRWLVVHMTRDVGSVAGSLCRAGFSYELADAGPLTDVEAAEWFRSKAARDADLTITHEGLMADPTKTISHLVETAHEALG